MQMNMESVLAKGVNVMKRKRKELEYKMNYKFTSILIILMVLLAIFGGKYQ